MRIARLCVADEVLEMAQSLSVRNVDLVSVVGIVSVLESLVREEDTTLCGKSEFKSSQSSWS